MINKIIVAINLQNNNNNNNNNNIIIIIILKLCISILLVFEFLISFFNVCIFTDYVE